MPISFQIGNHRKRAACPTEVFCARSLFRSCYLLVVSNNYNLCTCISLVLKRQCKFTSKLSQDLKNSISIKALEQEIFVNFPQCVNYKI